MVGSRSLTELEGLMKGLANKNRLELLSKLRQPVSPDDVRLTPSMQDGQGTSGRPVAKPAVRRHVATLEELGVVVEMKAEGSKAPRYMVDLARLFLLLERLRSYFAWVQADVPELDPDALEGRVPAESFLPQNGVMRTLRLPEVDPEEQLRHEGPRLELVRGLGEGDAFFLAGEGPVAGEVVSWTVGRSPHSDVRLEYDPYVAPVHARVIHGEGGFFVEDVPGNTNGTCHNWSRLGEGARGRLRDKDVVEVGRSLLVFRE